MIEQLKKQMTSSRLSLKTITALFLFGAIIVVFVLFGFQGKHTAMGVGAAARVNSSYISVADLRSETQRMEQMYGQFFGGQMNGEAQRQFFASQALESLISRELISQAAKDQGIHVTDAEVRDFVLTEMPVFQREGRFQREMYTQILEANHLSPSDFEDKVRKDRKNQRAQRLFDLAASPLQIEVEKMKLLKEKRINVAFAKIDDEKTLDAVAIPESEVNEKLKDSDFQKKVESDFNQNKASYSTQEEVKASHILIKTKEGDSNSEKQALEKIKAIQKRAEKEDFGKLAGELTEDIGSKSAKGDLGYFGKGKMVPEFEAVAFQLPVGKISEPVKSPFGYHLIKVMDKKAAETPSLEKMKFKIAKKILANDKLEVSIKKIEDLLKSNHASGDTKELDAILNGLGVKWDETGFFDYSVEFVPKLTSKVASQAAFEVSASKPLLNRVIRDGGQKYILRFKAFKKEASTDEKNLIAQVNRERTNEMFSGWLDQVKKSSTIEKNPMVLKSNE